MNKHTTNPRIIIDKSYIQGMHRDGAPFRAMCEQGGRIVLIDTLIYELCSTDNPYQWRASMDKLKAGVNAIEAWEHVSPMYKFELEQNRPYGGPLHDEKTKRMREMIANNPQYQPTDMKTLIKDYVKEREGNDIVTLSQGFANWPLPTQEIRSKAGDDEKVVQFCSDVVNNPDIIRSTAIGAIWQNMKEDGLDVLLNPEDVDCTWAIWHFGKSLLVMLCDSQRQGEDTFKKVSKTLEKRLINTKHDLDYLVLLAFADAIASGETRGEMSYYRRWMFGDDSKPLISSYEKDQIDPVMDRLKYGSTDKISDDEVRIPPVRPINRLFGALQHDGPAVTVEEMEQAIADGACEE